MKHLLLSALLLPVLLSGCRTLSHTIDDPERLAGNTTLHPGQATVYVFRGTGGGERMYAFGVDLDKTRMGSVRRERYISFPVSAGAHSVTISCAFGCSLPDHTLNFNATAGKSYYFKMDAAMDVYGMNYRMSTELGQLNQRMAEGLMKRYEQGKRVESAD